MMKPLLLVMGVAVVIALGPAPLAAQTAVDETDPPIFIGNATCPDSTCTNLYNGETIGIPSTSLTVWDQGAASKTTSTTILLIVAIPNTTSGAPGIASVVTAPVLDSSEVRMSSVGLGIRQRDSPGRLTVGPEARLFTRYRVFRAVRVEVPQRTSETFRRGMPTLRASE